MDFVRDEIAGTAGAVTDKADDLILEQVGVHDIKQVGVHDKKPLGVSRHSVDLAACSASSGSSSTRAASLGVAGPGAGVGAEGDAGKRVWTGGLDGLVRVVDLSGQTVWVPLLDSLLGWLTRRREKKRKPCRS